MTKSTLLDIAFKAADDKRAEDIVILNMQGISLLADYFLICHGNSDRQTQAIAREIADAAHKAGYQVKRMEGFDSARWILVDLGDVAPKIWGRVNRLPSFLR